MGIFNMALNHCGKRIVCAYTPSKMPISWTHSECCGQLEPDAGTMREFESKARSATRDRA
jgi:hypothetical protein